MDIKPTFQFDEPAKKDEESLPKLRLDEIPVKQRAQEKPEVNHQAEKKTEVRTEARLYDNSAELRYLARIADNTGSIKGWMTFIGILIIIGLVLQLFNSCMAAL